jgi:hypothetical protein
MIWLLNFIDRVTLSTVLLEYMLYFREGKRNQLWDIIISVLLFSGTEAGQTRKALNQNRRRYSNCKNIGS